MLASHAKAAETLNFSDSKPIKNCLMASNRFKRKRMWDLYLLSM